MPAYWYRHILIVAFINIVICQYQDNTQDDILNPKGSLRLPKNLEPIKYKLELEPFLQPIFTFNGKLELEFRCIESTNRIIIHVKNLTIADNDVNLFSSNKIENIPNIKNIFEVEDKNFLVIELNSDLEKGNIYKLAIDYEGVLSDDMSGFYRSSYKDAKGIERWIATTQFEATYARNAFPCFDEPGMKAVFEVTIVRPQDMVALSNTEIVDSKPRDESSIADRFKPSVKMSTYLLAFIICDFDFEETLTKRGIKVRVWAQRDLIHEAKYSVDLAANTIDFYESYFGIDFPLNKMDLVAIPDFAAGAMENWGLITFRETRILINEDITTAISKEATTVTVTHELGHQWFGNLVTMEWWDDLWLNEGFATAMEYISANYSRPSWQLDDRFIYHETMSAQISDSFVESHPISAKVSNPDEINEIFDDISYSKGAALIRMMDFILGSLTFRKGLKNYLTTLSYKNAVQADLWQFLSEAAKSEGKDIDVAKTMDSWTLQMGYPIVTIKRDYEKKKTYITQKHFLAHMGAKLPNDEKYVWEVPVTITKESDLDWNTPKIIWLHGNNKTYDDLLEEEYKWIIGNSKLLGYFRVNYDLENWRMLIKQLKEDHTVIHSNNRGQIIFDSFALARAGHLDYQIPLEASQYLIQENDLIPWSLSMSSLDSILDILRGVCKDKSIRVYIVKLLLPAYNRIGWDEYITKDPHVTQLFRNLVIESICSAGYKKCILKAKQEFKKWKANPEKRLSPNLKPTIWCNGIRNGDSSDWEFMWNQYLKSQEVSEKIEMLSALGCTKDKKILEKYLQMTLDSKDIRRMDGPAVISYVASNSKGYLLAWEFFKTKWTEIKKKFSGTPWRIKKALNSMSVYFSSEKQLNELKEFYESNKDNLGSAKRAVKQAIETTQGNVLWINKNEKFILEWLKYNLN